MTRNILLKAKYPHLPKSHDELRDLVAGECTRCGICTLDCHFLDRHGTPGQIATTLKKSAATSDIPFFCSLCGLCTHHCPQDLPVAEMFRGERTKAALKEPGLLKRYRAMQWYEWLGGSAFFRGYYLPAKCDTVFFPGCSLPGIRSEETTRLYTALKNSLPDLGLVLDCCGKISSDLGDNQTFEAQNRKLLGRLRHRGVQHIITTCPSCMQHFKQHGDDLDVSLAYSHLAMQDRDSGDKREKKSQKKYTIHDSCTSRFDSEVQQAVRKLLARSGAEVSEMRHSAESCLCCGEGGGTAFLDPAYKMKWQEKRGKEIEGRTVVTYCAGCELSLAHYGTVHLLDLIYPTEGKKGKEKGRIRFYLNRLIFKVKMCLAHFSG